MKTVSLASESIRFPTTSCNQRSLVNKVRTNIQNTCNNTTSITKEPNDTVNPKKRVLFSLHL